MEHFRLRKYRGPEVWERVREAYVAGEAGPQLARRFDVGLANLRKKAMREGWTRRAAAAASDPLILATQPRLLGAGPGCADVVVADPVEARARAIAQAAALLGEGRAAEASAILKAAETLGRITGIPAAGPMDPAQAEAERQEQQGVMFEMVRFAVERRAEDLVQRLLDTNFDNRGHYTLFALKWRAAQLGPEVAEHDRRRCEAQGLATDFYDADGRLLPFGGAARAMRDGDLDPWGLQAHWRETEGEAEGEGEANPVTEGPRAWLS